MQIRNLQEKELPLFYTYANAEQWDIEDLHIRSLLKTHPDDFFIFYKRTELLGFVVALRESEQFGFISSLLVLKPFRSLGYGKEIFTFACEHLGERQIGLDSVLGQESFYEKFGFKRYFDVNTYRFETGKFLLNNDDYEIVNFDETLCLESQSPYLIELLSHKEIECKTIKSKESDCSFAFAFSYKDGYKITLQTQEINQTIALFFALCRKYQNNTPIYIQSTKMTPMLEALAEALQMKRVSYFTRMYNKIL
ncbi:MAG: GNAT family N-acetyltransferase [Sulfurimonas sp.]|nr:GNAT family N-acetyltransferase [Sulfurimonas sp.]